MLTLLTFFRNFIFQLAPLHCLAMKATKLGTVKWVKVPSSKMSCSPTPFPV